MGTDIIVAIKVIISVDTKKGKIPKVGGSDNGYHLVPNKNSQGLVKVKTGNPSLSRMVMMPSSITIDSIPARKIQLSMTLSPSRSRRFRFIFCTWAAVVITPCFNIAIIFSLFQGPTFSLFG
jgi:hypothetical protein